MQRGDSSVSVKTVGEPGVVAAIERIAATTDPTVIVGIGDDAAVLQPAANRQLVVTTDMQLEDVHFKLAYATAFDVGWKAMAVNLSDIGAMGGMPRYAVISLALRPELELRWIEELYQGLREVGAAFGVSIVGGNLARTSGPSSSM
jgi:thiamine-monophosphate kinase